MQSKGKRTITFNHMSMGILVLLIIAITLSWALLKRQPHAFENNCHYCHVGSMDPSILTRDVDFLCLSCHQSQKQLSHPVGMIPQREIPLGFPLYKKRIRCITCHIAHTTYDDTDYEHKRWDGNPFFLRYKTPGKLFCFQCHSNGTESFEIKKVDAHAMGFGRAHMLGHDIVLKQVLDDGSRDCLICHDGTLSQDATVKVAGADWEHSQSIGVSHPIGIDYGSLYRKNPRRLRNPGALDRRIKLVEGKVGCQSCHSHFSKLPHLLVMENDGSKLCLQCHNI